MAASWEPEALPSECSLMKYYNLSKYLDIILESSFVEDVVGNVVEGGEGVEDAIGTGNIHNGT